MLHSNMMLSPAAINLLVLSIIRSELRKDVYTASSAWGVSASVGEVIKSMTEDQVSLVSKRCRATHLVRLVDGSDLDRWTTRLTRAKGQNHTPFDQVTSLVSMLIPEMATNNTRQSKGINASCLIALSTAKSDLRTNFASALQQWSLSFEVGQFIAALSDGEIDLIANSVQNVSPITVVRPLSPSFWMDLSNAAGHSDCAGIDLSIVASIFLPPMTVCR